MRLKGKVAIITGAGRGIGRATAMRFAEEGALVVAADIDVDSIQEVADEINLNGSKTDMAESVMTQNGGSKSNVDAAVAEVVQAIAIQVDVTKQESVQEMVQQTLDQSLVYQNDMLKMAEDNMKKGQKLMAEEQAFAFNAMENYQAQMKAASEQAAKIFTPIAN